MALFNTAESLKLKWEIWEQFREAYLLSLAELEWGSDPSFSMLQMNSFKGDRKYKELKSLGKLPKVFQIGERIRDNKDSSGICEPFSDPVYRFLLDVRGLIEKTAEEMYDRDIAPYRRGRDDSDKDYFLEGKVEALEKMIEFFETRGKSPIQSKENESLRANTQERYDYLASLADSKGLFNQQTLERFVNALPSASFYSFNWPEIAEEVAAQSANLDY